MNEKEAQDILDKVRYDTYPPTNIVVLSDAQLLFAKKGKTKPAACVAQWVFQLEGGKIDYDDWRKICEI